jgi:ribonuclease P protein component
MYILPKESKGAPKADWKPLTGFVVAKKVSKSAVKRNRAKRKIREVYRLLRTSVFNGERQDIALRDWYAIVFVAHEGALEATYEQVEEAVVSCLVRASSKNRKDRQGGPKPVSQQGVSGAGPSRDRPNPNSSQGGPGVGSPRDAQNSDSPQGSQKPVSHQKPDLHQGSQKPAQTNQPTGQANQKSSQPAAPQPSQAVQKPVQQPPRQPSQQASQNKPRPTQNRPDKSPETKS